MIRNAHNIRNPHTGNVILPDWLGSGQDLFGTIQIIKDKQVDTGFLEMDFDFRFSDAFNYPIVFCLRSVEEGLEIYAISFRINGNIDKATRTIEERIIAPKVCQTVTKQDFVRFFADIVQHDVDFALYFNKTPKKFQDITLFQLKKDQRIILEERFVMQIAKVLDERSGRTDTTM